ncbi:conserved Plasmodium protein, unknown function [Plasmodium relictum]|uniref:Uncharacterized protein n=1 Tax=Plasmodium relictum TaxID=85471 RepID=A0A1J1H9V9_PLARL|nr:conserved Plasmodium protein, unknown function [Plasmodium relictum]CRH00383.1 conserved Plasmodium protein, unknown function [Plasmodium relictum]
MISCNIKKRNGSEDCSGNSSFCSLETEILNLYKKDDYMKYCFVSDNIEPIALDDEIHILKKVEQESFKLNDILKSLETKKEKEKSDILLSEYEKHEIIENEIEDEDRINCGIFLHDVNIIDNSNNNFLSDNIFDKSSNPISIKGDVFIKNIVEFQDLSPCASSYEVYKIEWFLGLDINDNRVHEIVPIHQGKNFQIPFEALGKYIFCKAYRRIYKNFIFQEKGKNSVFDPHTSTTKPIKFKRNPEYIEFFSVASKGPVLISLDVSMKILTHLCNNNYSVKVIIEDPLDNLYHISSPSSSDDDMTYTTTTNSTQEKNYDQSFLTTLSINFNEIEFDFSNDYNGIESNLKKKESIFNFFKLFGFNHGNSSLLKEENSNSLGNEIVYKKGDEVKSKENNNYNKQFYKKKIVFNIYEVEFRLSNKEDCIVITIGSDLQKSFRHVKYKMINIKSYEKNTSINELWLILLAFKSAYSYKNIFKKHSKIIYRNTNISFIQNMLNKYLIKSATKNVNEKLPFHKINTIFNET